MEYGPERLLKDLTDLGFSAEFLTATDNKTQFIVIPSYEINLGQFVDKVIGLGLRCTPDFPRSVHSSLHVKADPQLYTTDDSLDNVRNIQQSPLGDEWMYWSTNYNWNTHSNKTCRRLISQINSIFEKA